MQSAADFAKLSLKERTWYVEREGKLLLSRHGYKYTCALYAVGGFFVEQWVNRETGLVIEVAPIEDPGDLDAYLDGISLDEML